LAFNDCSTWHCSEKINQTITPNHSNDQIKSIPIKPISISFINKQKVIIMPNDKNKNNSFTELPLTTSSTTIPTIDKSQYYHYPQHQIEQNMTYQPKQSSLQQHHSQQTLSVNVGQNSSDNLKLIDSRRTTPRQLKQHQIKRSQPKSPSSLTTNIEPTSTTTSTVTISSELCQQKYQTALNHSYSEKAKTISSSENAHSSKEKSTFPQQTTSSDLATSFIRTASLHLKSTLSRLKRSNSGHSNRPFDANTTTTTTTTTTDIHTTVLPSVRTIDVNETVSRHNSLPSDSNDKTIKFIAEINKTAKQSYKEPSTTTTTTTTTTTIIKNINKSSSSSSPPSPGYTKWSTRLGPPPSPYKTKDLNTSVIYPKCCTSSIPYHETNTIGTVVTTAMTSTLLSFNVVNDSKKDVSILSNTTTTTVTTTNTTNSSNISSVFQVLPKYERNELNYLSTNNDDCASFGEFGQINLRTGSFMGRYPNYSHSNHQLVSGVQHGQSLFSGHDNHHHNHNSGIQQHQQQQHEQKNLSEYRPLYLSIQSYTTSSPSGNTTRSAPSPSLSSMTSTHGLSGYHDTGQHSYQQQQQQTVYCHPQNQLITLKTPSSSCSSVAKTHSPRVNSVHNPQLLHTVDNPNDHYSIPITHPHEMLLLSSSSSPSCVTPHPELDPILERLLLDVTSIDEYRTALHTNDSITPPLSTNRQRTINRMHTPLGSSDPESISRSAEHIINMNLSNQQKNILNDDNICNLNKQINDLIQ
ncbi:unnamed protein product, partial [Schistosoma turkestanicum]